MAENTSYYGELSRNEVELQENKENLLGKGAFAKIFKGKFRDRDVAVKVMTGNMFEDAEGLPIRDEVMAREEANKMWQARSPLYVVGVIGIIIWNNPSKYAIVMEYMEKGKLTDIIKKGETSWNQKKIWICHIAEALDWLHHKLDLGRIVHGDVKMDNVLINKDDIAKLADFGISKLYHSQTRGMSKLTSGVIGTKFHIAPELFKNGNSGRNEKTDVYSFGITVYMIYSNCNEDIFTVSQTCPVCDETIQRTPCDDGEMKRIMNYVKNSCLCEIQGNRKGFTKILEELKRKDHDETDAETSEEKQQQELITQSPTEGTGQEKMGASGDKSLADELQKMAIQDSICNQVPPDMLKGKTVVNTFNFRGGETVHVGDVYNVTNQNPSSSPIPEQNATDKMETTDQIRVRKNYKDIVKSLRIKDIQDNLHQNGVLNSEDMQHIEAKVTEEDRVRYVLEILPSRGKLAYSNFRAALEENYQSIGKKLDDTNLE